jgi:hypothetical protein
MTRTEREPYTRRMCVRLSQSRMFVTLCLMTAACACGQAGDAVPQGAATPADNGPTTTLQVQSQLVFVPTTVTLGKEDVLYELKANQFVVEDNGVPQRVRLDESDEVRPLSLVVAVQCSRSAIAEFDKLQGLPTMLDAVLGGAPAEVAVIQFGTGEELLAGFTHDEATRDRALSKIRPCEDDGGANIFDAVDYANTLLEAHKAKGRRAVLLISETRDHGSETRAETVIRELGRSNTIVDAASFSPERDEMVDDLSGGEYINFRTQKAFDHGMDMFANHVHNFYMLSFVPRFGDGAGAAAPGLHRITVKVPEYPKVTLRYRESYWAEGAVAAAAK